MYVVGRYLSEERDLISQHTCHIYCRCAKDRCGDCRPFFIAHNFDCAAIKVLLAANVPASG